MSDGEENAEPTQALKKIKEQLRTCEKERGEYLAGWQRAKADFVNAKRQEEKERAAVIDYAKELVLYDILEIADNLEMALIHQEEPGIRSIYQKLISIFGRHGLKLMEAKPDDPFDPAFHLSLEGVPTEDESKEHKIHSIVKNGYILENKVVRPTHVKIWQKS